VFGTGVIAAPCCWIGGLRRDHSKLGEKMKHILILMILHFQGSITTAEFQDNQACLLAGEKAQSKAAEFNIPLAFMCMPEKSN